MSSEPDRLKLTDEPPPFLRAWRWVYLAVLGWLALLIVLFYAFARTFSK